MRLGLAVLTAAVVLTWSAGELFNLFIGNWFDCGGGWLVENKQPGNRPTMNEFCLLGGNFLPERRETARYKRQREFLQQFLQFRNFTWSHHATHTFHLLPTWPGGPAWLPACFSVPLYRSTLSRPPHLHPTYPSPWWRWGQQLGSWSRLVITLNR